MWITLRPVRALLSQKPINKGVSAHYHLHFTLLKTFFALAAKWWGKIIKGDKKRLAKVFGACRFLLPSNVLERQEPVGGEDGLRRREQVLGRDGIQLLEELLLGECAAIMEEALGHPDSHVLEVVI